MAEALWAHHDVLVSAFSYYSSLGVDSSIGCANDLSFLTLNSWTQFLESSQLVKPKSKYCKRADMDRLFLSVDAAAQRVEKERKALKDELASRGVSGGSPNQQLGTHAERLKALSRIEYISALVMVAINKYILTKTLVRTLHHPRLRGVVQWHS